MADGNIAMNAQIKKLRKLAKLVDDSAPDVAKAVKVEMVKQIDKATGPDGKAWQVTQAGTRPLKNAAQSLTVQAAGAVIILRLIGRHARHHLGAVKGKIKREILPTRKIPDPVARAIGRVVTGEFKRTMGI